jgi:hypothetical protein
VTIAINALHPDWQKVFPPPTTPNNKGITMGKTPPKTKPTPKPAPKGKMAKAPAEKPPAPKKEKLVLSIPPPLMSLI